ncbi:MAG: hypothetical protein NXY57DRAFT_738422 [Lentinula lateritia]|nr:MAG: hypothetical protein NXY57DRAFT_738422 [Lentinula lateritia]
MCWNSASRPQFRQHHHDFRRKDGKIYGVLNDFDLSSRVADMDKGPTSNQRTSTRTFRSLDLLCPTWTGGHLYRHNSIYESLFHIMLCLACRYKKPRLEMVRRD